MSNHEGQRAVGMRAIMHNIQAVQEKDFTAGRAGGGGLTE